MESGSSTIDMCELPKHNKSKKPKFRKRIGLPRSALALYIKLYCHKKGTKNSKITTNIVEATQSWLTLSDKEKQQFFNKYKECQRNYIQIVGDCLQKAQPYMKKKLHKTAQKNCLPEENIDKEDKMDINHDNKVQIEISEKMQDSYIDTSECKTEINIDECETKTNDNNEPHFMLDHTKSEHDIEICFEDSQDSSKITFYTEPTPPSVKTGKELFEITNLTPDVTWDSLTYKEKYVYSRAVVALKQDYIQKYRQYLEQLPQRELFYYYNKTLK